MALPPLPAAGGAPGMMPPDPMMGGGAAPPPAPAMADSNVVCTICRASGGDGYTVFRGDEPDAEMGGMSSDDVAAMGPAGDAPAPIGGGGGGGQPADSIGAALKIVMDILQADASSQGGAGSEDQFSAGYGADKNPTPATKMGQKY